ncbi:MAG: YdcH family protein [Novosphingobium sp.]
MDTSHSNSLQLKHAGLERKIEAEMSRPMPNDSMIQSLKKQKLRIKEQLSHH